MDFERFKKLNEDRPHYGELDEPSVVSAYRNTGCGDGYRLYLKINDNGIIDEASYTTTGCGFSLAALSMACEWLKGRSKTEAENITAADIESLFEFPERRKNYPETAVEAVKKAMSDYKNGTGIDPADRISKDHALEILKNQGHLRGEKLTQVVLENENLEGVDLSGANLSHAFLVGANLKNANLSGAKLRGAFLNQADLEGADLSGADLRWAKFTQAKMEGVKVEEAVYDIGTRFDPKFTVLFDKMIHKGKDSFTESEEKAGV